MSISNSAQIANEILQDEYVMTFARVRGGDYKVISVFHFIQVGDLRSTFTLATGLAVSL